MEARIWAIEKNNANQKFKIRASKLLLVIVSTQSRLCNQQAIINNILVVLYFFPEIEIFFLPIVPIRWNNIAINWMRIIAKKKNTRTIPIGSKWRYSFVMMTFENSIN